MNTLSNARWFTLQKQTVSFNEEEELEGYESPLSASIEVVHSQAPPNLHGILKQRSFSESSEDHSSLSSGDSPTGSSPRDSDSSGGVKRSVSFSDHVDKTTFKSNASVNSMKQTLKCKRKRQRKREEKKKEKEGRRRRHNSSEGSSNCDELDHQKEEVSADNLAKQLEESGKNVDDNGVIEEDYEDINNNTEDNIDQNMENNEEIDVKDESKEEGYQIHSEIQVKPKKKNKIVEQVKSKMAEKQVYGGIDSDDEEDKERTSEISEKEIFKTTGEIQHKDVYKTSGKNLENVSKDLDVKVNGNSQMAAESDSGGTTSDSKHAIKGNNPGKADEKKAVKFKNEGSRAESEITKGKVDDKANDGKEPVKSDVETALSWQERNGKGDPNNEHRTQCAFTFSNDVMFDLDVE